MRVSHLSHTDLSAIVQQIVDMLSIDQEWDCPHICSEIASLLDEYNLIEESDGI